MTLQSVRGMNDLLPPESAKWLYFEDTCRRVFERHGYAEIRTPILESTELFSRGIGEATEVVDKQMYTFPDRKERSLTMRPEMTASCVRAYLQHQVAKQEPVTRWYYTGPMFRYERVQAGRYRQFYQVGVEAFGVAEPSVDAEQIAMLYALYRRLGLDRLEVVINSVGGKADRPAYREALVAHFTPHREALCPDCQRRLELNPLRILDCKVPGCAALAAAAPSVLDHLTEASAGFFAGVRRCLDLLQVPYRVDARLVRGLDYYTGPVFEILGSGGGLGSQNALGGGGRYDDLVEQLGGPPTPAVGFAIGVERAMLTLPGAPETYLPTVELFVATLGEAARARGLALATALREAGRRVELEHRAVGMKAQMRRADKMGARFVVVLGDDEIASGQVKLKDMKQREEIPVSMDALAAELERRLG